MDRPVYITGLGVISSVGTHVAENLDSLLRGKSGIGPLRHLETVHGSHASFGEVPFANVELAQLAGVAMDENISRTAYLGMIAGAEAFRDAGIQCDDGFKTGLVSATTVGGMGIVENCFQEIIEEQYAGDLLACIQSLDCSDSTERIASHLGIKDYITTISTACSSSANAIMFGARMVKNGILDRVLVGGTDALSRFTINGFNCLKILDKSTVKPFDVHRNGLNLGEGAGYLVIESERAAKGKRVYGILSGYANTNDAFHQTASSPDGQGAYEAMKTALEVSGVPLSEIDYINAHGTGTELNDLSEGLAISRLFKGRIPPVSSTKAITGHTLAAAGGIEAVFAVLSMHHGVIFKNHNLTTPMPEIDFVPQLETQSRVMVRNVLSNSFGFGGNTSSLVFSKIPD